MGANGKKGRKKRVTNGKDVPAKDPGNGQFLVGNTAGGRTKGSLDFLTVCKRKAKAAKKNLDDMLWEVFVAMVDHAKKGDAAAANFVANRLCGAVDKAPIVAIQNNVSAGPPIPPVEDLEVAARKLIELVGDDPGGS